jgi:hypothetical protein
MKKIILGLVLSVVLCSCTKSPEEQAKSNISEYLKKNMDDPSSYESVEFGKLDTLHTSFSESKEGIELETKDSKLGDRVTELSNKLDLPDLTLNDIKNIQKENEQITKDRLAINDIIAKKTLTYKGSVNGYSMTHKFRGKNKLGAKILNEINFLLDTKLVVLGESQ